MRSKRPSFESGIVELLAQKGRSLLNRKKSRLLKNSKFRGGEIAVRATSACMCSTGPRHMLFELQGKKLGYLKDLCLG